MHEGARVPTPADSERRRMIVKVSLFSLLLAPVAAALVGLLWRFPVPLSGYISGPQAIIIAPVATLFFLLLGGAVAIPLVAIAVHVLLTRTAGRPASSRTALLAGGTAALLFALFMASLEFIIGPW